MERTLTPSQVLEEARRLGIELKASGDKLLIRCDQTVPEELTAALRGCKAELLDLLRQMDTPHRSEVNVERLKRAEANSRMDAAPPDVVLCIPDPDQPDNWLAYRRTNRTLQGCGDTQAVAVLDLAKVEESD